jgi:integrase
VVLQKWGDRRTSEIARREIADLVDRIADHGVMRNQLGDNVVLKPWRIHDLRRTAATGMERLGVKQQVVEALLGHIAGSKAGITGIYQRYMYEEEKRIAIEKWAEHIATLARGTR